MIVIADDIKQVKEKFGFNPDEQYVVPNEVWYYRYISKIPPGTRTSTSMHEKKGTGHLSLTYIPQTLIDRSMNFMLLVLLMVLLLKLNGMLFSQSTLKLILKKLLNFLVVFLANCLKTGNLLFHVSLLLILQLPLVNFLKVF